MFVKMNSQNLYLCLLFVFLSNFCETLELRGNKTEVYVIRYLEGGRITPVTVFLNFNQQTELVITSKRGRKSETFYDFVQGYVAYKDDNSSHCFIEKLQRESLEADSERLKNLQNGVVREFYLPTFTVGEDLSDTSEILQKFGHRIAHFCNSSVVSIVRKEAQINRRKRDVSATSGDGQKGQFTHHSYGHYGHQTNNYAHYGHETHVTGTVDKDGNIRDQRIQQHQMRSEGSQSMPVQEAPNDFQSRSDDQRFHQTSPMHGRPLTAAQNNFNTMGNEFGRNSGGQFSLQTDQESGYQLNLPLGLRAGNAYRGGIRSQGQYGVGRTQPQISSEFQRYPSGPKVTTGVLDGTKVGGLPMAPDHRVIRPPTHPKPISPEIQYTNGRVQVPSTPGLRYDEHGRPITTDVVSERRYDEHGRPITPGVVPGQGNDEYGRPITADVDLGRRYDARGRPIDAGAFPGRRYNEYGRPISAGAFPGHRYDEYGRPIFAGAIPGRHYDEQGRTIATDVPGRHFDEHGTPITKDVSPGLRDGDQISPAAQRPMLPVGTVPGIRKVSGHPTSTYSGGHDGLPLGISTMSGESSGFVPGSEIPRQHPGLAAPGYPLLAEGTSASQDSLHERYRPGQFVDGRTNIPGYMPGTLPTGPPGSPLSTPQGIYTHPFRPSSTPVEVPGQQIRSDVISPESVRLTDSQGKLSRGVLPDARITTSPEAAQLITRHQTSQYPDIPGRIQERPYVARDFRSPTNIRTPHLQAANGLGDSSRISATRIPGSTFDSHGTPLDSVYSRGIPSRFDDSRGRETIQHGSRSTDALGASWPRRADVPSSIDIRQTSEGRNGDSRDSQFGIGSRDSASSQTQIQSGFEGTAAEASAAGNYRGLGSKTQVQGGYTGNGSFSAQAQSGFTGGLTQSQVQGGKQGGLSGSSAQVERVGAAQSQVQIGQPSGAASSSAQGRFSTGTTQVQAQSSKTGGSAGAQAQSRGLSNSQAQVNIGGGDSRQQNGFQGTVSASVQGGLSSAQSQTQLQGGYESGRTYSATAQGGFGSMSAFQSSIPADASLASQTRQPSILPPLQRIDFPSIGSTDRHHATGVNGQGIHSVRSDSVPQITDGIRLPGINELITPNVTRPKEERLRRPLPPGYESFQPGFPSHLIPPDGLPDISSGRKVSGTAGTFPISPDMPSIPRISGALPGVSPPLSSIPGIQGGIRPSTIPSRTSVTGIQGVPGSTNIPGMISIPGISGALPGIPAEHSNIPGIQGAPGLLSRIPGGLSSIPGGLSSIPGIMAMPGTLPDRVSGIPGTLTGPSRMSSTFPGIPGLFPDSAARPETLTGTIPGMPGSVPNILSQQFPNYHLPSQLPIHATYPGSEQFQTGPVAGGQPGLQLTPSDHLPSQAYPVHSRPHVGLPSAILQPPAASRTNLRPADIPNIFQTSLSGQQGSLPGTVLQPAMPGQVQISPPGPIFPDGSQQGHATLPSSTTSGSVQRPGSREPDGKNCCDAFKNLKQRCCGSSRSSCCSNGAGDNDFELDDDLDENNGENSCKIVKAICYIVYKPIGKARICKPTKTNGCR